MELVWVILSFAGFLIFFGWTLFPSKNKTGKSQFPLMGFGLFLVLALGSLFYYNQNLKQEADASLKVKTVAQPKKDQQTTEEKSKTEEKQTTEEQPKSEEPPKVMDDRVEIVHGLGSKVRGPADPKYVMDVTYDSIQHLITGSMSVEFKNNLDVDLNDLYFNVWANAFNFYPNGETEPNVKISQLKLNGQPANFTLERTVLHIPEVSIKKGSSTKVEMEFSVKVPENLDRFGWNKTTTSLGNWFPILAVYDNEGWNADPYYAGGESFYSLTGSFDVTFTTEKEQVIATTGTEVGNAKINENLATHHYKADRVRDFAMELDPTYKIKQANVGNVKINVYFTDEQSRFADEMVNSATKSLSLFNEKFGQYPWPELDVCGMEGWFGGMEYPQLTMITITKDTTTVNLAVAHEIGHQWFYGVIGNNEFDEPWLDESITSFAHVLFLGETEVNRQMDQSRLYETHLSSNLDTFAENVKQGQSNYGFVIYMYGAEVVNDLRKELGDEQFYSSMKAYFNQMKFGVSTTEDFIRIMEETSERDLSQFFEEHRIFVEDQQ